MSNLLTEFLNILFNFTNDWGMAIVFLTLAVKLMLLPLSIKQKLSLKQQGNMSLEIEEIKKKYENDKVKMDEEIKQYYMKNSKTLIGCFISLIQLPIIFSLFKVIRTLNVDIGSKLVPWVDSLRVHDSSYIIPIVYILVSIAPLLLGYINYFKEFNENKSIKQNIVMIIIISVLVIIKSPVALGIYFVTNSLVGFIEQIIYMIIMKRNNLPQTTR